MHFLFMALIGLVAGVLAKLIMPGKDPGGMIVTILLGIAGAMIAGWIGRTIGYYRYGEAPGIIASALGAIIILGIYRLLLPKIARA